MPETGFGRFFLRVTACHMVTYFVAGLLAFTLLDYATAFQSEHLACWMRPTTSRWVAAGPGLQWIRGFIFALALYPFRRVFLEGGRGWLKLWGLLLGLRSRRRNARVSWRFPVGNLAPASCARSRRG